MKNLASKLAVLFLCLFLNGCWSTLAATFAGANVAYNGYQEYKDTKKEKQATIDREKERLEFEEMEKRRIESEMEERE